MKSRLLLVTAGLLATSFSSVYGQVWNTIDVTGGFNSDVIAETTPASTTTDDVLDGSNYILYSMTYGASYSTGTGLPDNGTITSGTRNYQLQDFAQPNCMKLTSTILIDSFDVVTPASYSKISLLGFATEGSGSVTVTLRFTDGTSYTSTGLSVSDWFYNSNQVINGFDRAGQTTGTPDYSTSEPRMYPIDVAIPCASQTKMVQRVVVTNTSSGATRICLFAVSGTANLTATISAFTDVTCNGANNGTATVTAAGGGGSYTYSWLTSPVQHNATAYNLAPGSYYCIVTDGNGCTKTSGTVTIAEPGVLSGSQSVSICQGDTLFVGNGAHTAAGTYTDTVTSINGCDSILTTTLSVMPAPTVNGGSDVQVCSGTQVTLTATGTNTFSWDNGVNNGVPFVPAMTGAYVVTGTDANGCTAMDTVMVTVEDIQAQATLSNEIDLTASPSGMNYAWVDCGNGMTAIPGATSVRVYGYCKRKLCGNYYEYRFGM